MTVVKHVLARMQTDTGQVWPSQEAGLRCEIVYGDPPVWFWETYQSQSHLLWLSRSSQEFFHDASFLA